MTSAVTDTHQAVVEAHGCRRFVGIGCMLLSLWLGGCASTQIAPWAIERGREPYVGRYIGGGAHFGEPRRWHEGTWARDYAGLDLFHLVELRWSHSRSYRQGGIGSY